MKTFTMRWAEKIVDRKGRSISELAEILKLEKENAILNRIIKLMLDDFCLDRPLKGYDPVKGNEIYETNDEIIAKYRIEAEKEKV